MRKLTLFVTAVVAALALTASTAAAQNVTIIAEGSGQPCPAVSPSDSTIEFPISSTVRGGCVTHVVSTEGAVVVTAHIFGVESTDAQCSIELTPRVGSNGEGYFTNISMTGAACTRRPCGTAVGAPEAWELHMEETTSSSARFEIHLCVENVGGGGRQTCHLFAPFREDPAGGSHFYEIGTANASETRTEIGCEGFTGFRAELSLHWKTELNNIEVLHLL